MVAAVVAVVGVAVVVVVAVVGAAVALVTNFGHGNVFVIGSVMNSPNDLLLNDLLFLHWFSSAVSYEAAGKVQR